MCIDLYIAAKTIGGLGHGDDRGPSSSGGSYRAEMQLAIDPGSGSVGLVKDDAGVSKAKIIGVPDSPLELSISRKGTSSTTLSPVTTDDQGNMHFAVYNEATNGLKALPGAPQDSIKTDIKFVVTPSGAVGLDPGGSRTAYPSMEIYKYDGSGKATTILQVLERKPEDLCCRNQPIPRVPPQ